MPRKYRNAALRLPKYRHHRASDRAVIQFRPLWGEKEHYLPGLYDSPESRQAYAEACQRIIAYKLAKRPSDPTTKARGNLNLSSVVVAFLRHAETEFGGAKSREYSHYRRACHYLRPYDRTLAREFGPLKFQEARTAMVAAGKWSRGYINAQVNRLVRLFRWAVSQEYVPASVPDALANVKHLRKGKTTARETPKVQKIDWAEVQRLFPFVPPVLRTMIEVQYLTGMRSDELTRMRGDHIDTSGPTWIYAPKQHKTAWRGKVKVICLGPRAREIIQTYLDTAGDGYLFSPRIAMQEHYAARRAASKTMVYGKRAARPKCDCSRFRPRYYTDSYKQAIEYGFARAEKQRIVDQRPESEALIKWNPHRLRHTRATETRKTFGKEGVEAQLGNTREAAELYGDKDLGLACRIAQQTG